mmetsp:Transcript_32589/g.85480  ORF Transcript_32589/g.85480 Transcript_32589/m.85480 type:complete len:212 (+) Transcript_32589:837-1472(+)
MLSMSSSAARPLNALAASKFLNSLVTSPTSGKDSPASDFSIVSAGLAAYASSLLGGVAIFHAASLVSVSAGRVVLAFTKACSSRRNAIAAMRRAVSSTRVSFSASHLDRMPSSISSSCSSLACGSSQIHLAISSSTDCVSCSRASLFSEASSSHLSISSLLVSPSGPRTSLDRGAAVRPNTRPDTATAAAKSARPRGAAIARVQNGSKHVV